MDSVNTFLDEKEARMTEARHDWSREEARHLYARPCADLMFQAQTVHRAHFDPNRIECPKRYATASLAQPNVSHIILIGHACFLPDVFHSERDLELGVSGLGTSLN
jgi:hypothetical protein